MKRLLWKELREKRVLVLALIASASGPIIFGDNYKLLSDSFTAVNTNPLGWIALSIFAALCLGTSAHSSELGGTADFARSRPISWKKLLAAKLIIGAASVLLAVVLAVVTFRIMLPARYFAFFNPAGLAPGIKWMLVTLGLSYLLGFICSVIVPSVMGGLAICLLLLFSFVIELLWYQNAHLTPIAWWSFLFRLVGAAVAVVLISRFGMTLSASYRALRFTGVVLAFVAVGIPMNFHVPDPTAPDGRDIAWSLSPSGNYAGYMGDERVPGKHDTQIVNYLVRMSDGKKAKAPGARDFSGSPTFWYKDTVASCSSDHVWMGRMDSSGRLHESKFSIGGSGSDLGIVRQSPSGRFLLLVRKQKGIVWMADIDQMSGRMVVVGPGVQDYWWKSDTVIGYIDDQGPHSFDLRH